MSTNNSEFYKAGFNAQDYLSEYYRRNYVKSEPKRLTRHYEIAIHPINTSLDNNPIVQSQLKVPKSDRAQRNISSFASFIRSTLKQFADNTTLHGFREVYYAKSVIWKLIWIVAICCTVGLSAYQLYSSVLSSLENPTITLIQPLQPLSSQVLYPPLTICYVHWLLWLNWEKASILGFDKPSVLYGMSFLSDIISETQFNGSEAKTSFETLMKMNNFTTILQFYQGVSSSSPPGVLVQYLDADSVDWDVFLDPTYPYPRLCYRLSSDEVKTSKKSDSQKPKWTMQAISKFAIVAPNTINTIELVYNNSYLELTENVTQAEYAIYLSRYVSDFISSIQVHNITDMKISPMFNVDMVRTNIFMVNEDVFEMRFRLAGSFYSWLHYDNRPCSNAKPKQYEFCDKFCDLNEILNHYPEACVGIAAAHLIDKFDIHKICSYDIYNLESHDVFRGNSASISNKIDRFSVSYNSCIATNCITPCEHWKFINTLSTIPFPVLLTKLGLPTLIDIEYPLENTILAFTEVPSATWETMIGNIGGIVGLWMGASIMSILQIVYLCCCSGCDGKIATGFEIR